jgi:hypothetical protein
MSMDLLHCMSRQLALPGRKLRYIKWLNLRQLLELSDREMGCGSEDFGLKMTHLRHWLRTALMVFSLCQSACFSGYNAGS